MSDHLEPEEADANWRHIIGISSLVFALALVAGAIYWHLKEKPQIINPQYVQFFGIPAAAVAASDPDVSASTSKEDVPEYNHSSDNNNIDSDNIYDDYSEGFEKDFAGNITIGLTNVDADSESESESDSDSAEAIEAGTDFRTSLQKVEQLQQELVRCNAANNKSEGLPTANTHTQPPPSAPLLTELCLQCICETATECRSVECGAGVACGIFRISYNYWIDAGRPRLQGVEDGKNMTERDVYLQCVSNTFCAARAVVENVKKYARDCNQDGKINCSDYAELHILGPHGCMRDEMPPIFAMRLERCLAKFS